MHQIHSGALEIIPDLPTNVGGLDPLQARGTSQTQRVGLSQEEENDDDEEEEEEEEMQSYGPIGSPTEPAPVRLRV